MSVVTYKNDCRGGRARAEGMEESTEPMAASGRKMRFQTNLPPARTRTSGDKRDGMGRGRRRERERCIFAKRQWAERDRRRLRRRYLPPPPSLSTSGNIVRGRVGRVFLPLGALYRLIRRDNLVMYPRARLHGAAAFPLKPIVVAHRGRRRKLWPRKGERAKERTPQTCFGQNELRGADGRTEFLCGDAAAPLQSTPSDALGASEDLRSFFLGGFHSGCPPVIHRLLVQQKLHI